MPLGWRHPVFVFWHINQLSIRDILYAKTQKEDASHKETLQNIGEQRTSL
jgi:hypothetical protein